MEDVSFCEVVCALHVAYHTRHNEISQFKKLVTIMLDILEIIHQSGHITKLVSSGSLPAHIKLTSYKYTCYIYTVIVFMFIFQSLDVIAVTEVLHNLALGSVIEPNQNVLANLMQCYYEVQQTIEHVLYSKETEHTHKQR